MKTLLFQLTAVLGGASMVLAGISRVSWLVINLGAGLQTNRELLFGLLGSWLYVEDIFQELQFVLQA